jgi:hypothetical protein
VVLLEEELPVLDDELEAELEPESEDEEPEDAELDFAAGELLDEEPRLSFR